MDIREVLGSNLKALRGTTPQAEVAESCGFEIGSLSRWENGKAWASDETIMKLASYYKVNPSDLYIERGFNSKLVSLESVKQSDMLKIFTNRVQSIPDKIYDMAQKFDPDHKVWIGVEKVMKDYLKDMEEEEAERLKKGQA